MVLVRAAVFLDKKNYHVYISQLTAMTHFYIYGFKIYMW